MKKLLILILFVLYVKADVAEDAYEADNKGDYKTAIKLYEIACDKGSLFSCSNLGLIYSEGKYIKQDKLKAAKLYSKACYGGLLSTCNNLAHLYIYGQGVNQDYKKAFELFTLSCNGPKSTFSCSNLGVMYDNGYGVKKDRKKAKELYKKSCDVGYQQGCINYKISLKDGI